jgi:signal transduction histidine kinase
MRRSLFSSPLRNKTALLLVAVISVPLLSLSALSLYLIDQSHTRDIAELERELLAQKEEEIKKYFSDTMGIIELRVTYSQNKEISIPQQSQLLRGLLDSNDAFETAAFFDLAGMETSKVDRAGDDLPLLDRSQLPYFSSLRDGKEYIGPVYQTLSGPMVSIASPVYNASSTIIQFLTADVHLKSLADSIASSPLGDIGYVTLADESGRVIGSGKGSLAPGESIASLPYISTLDEKKSNALTYYRSGISNTSVAGLGTIVPTYHWFLVAEWPLDDANGVINDIKQEVLMMALASLLAALLLAPIIARRITKPIELLEDDAAEIAKGNFTKEIVIDTNDELEELGKSFNTMAHGLRDLEALRNEFIHLVAHELRSPLTAIRGYVSELREGSGGVLPQQASSYVEIIWQSADHLGQLINDLLDAAKLEAGKFTLEMTDMPLMPAVDESVQEMMPLASEHHIELKVTGDESTVHADKTRLKQVLINFISNAIKYGSEKSTVTIALTKVPDGVKVAVTNAGKGIPEKEQKHIFEKYYRAEGQSTIVGTGLGLYVTKQLVEKMGGTIGFTSVPEKETVFFFTIPQTK